jgi:hypothetical protein
MNIDEIIQQINNEIDRLQQAARLLKGTGASAPGKRGGRRHMSAAGRARIAAAQRARWAKINAGKKK